tara:strand:- start:390 stop:1052 length:663 start_codon:yes stop_codon:yes gene_type:complete
MHITVENLINLEKNIQSKINNLNYKNYNPNIIAVSKTFKMDHINPLIEYGHIHFGENKVQEALEKWTEVKSNNNKIKLHMIGKLQTNKVKFAVQIFDYIHSLDNEKLAKKISEEQAKINKKLKLFIQINIGSEDQKSGIDKKNVYDFAQYCKELNLDVIGTMCLPPNDNNQNLYFSEMQKINSKLYYNDLSMGMSNDYLDAVEFKSSFLRVGSKIFGLRS